MSPALAPVGREVIEFGNETAGLVPCQEFYDDVPLWLAFGLVVLLSFSVLGWAGWRIYQTAPPVLDRVVTTDVGMLGIGLILFSLRSLDPAAQWK